MASSTDPAAHNSFTDFNREEMTRLADDVRSLQRTNQDLSARNTKLAEMLNPPATSCP